MPELTQAQRDVLTDEELRLYDYCKTIAEEYVEAQGTIAVVISLAKFRLENAELKTIRTRLQEKSEARRKMLKKHETVSYFNGVRNVEVCPECGCGKFDGKAEHTPDCALDALAKEG